MKHHSWDALECLFTLRRGDEAYHQLVGGSLLMFNVDKPEFFFFFVLITDTETSRRSSSCLKRQVRLIPGLSSTLWPGDVALGGSDAQQLLTYPRHK